MHDGWGYRAGCKFATEKCVQAVEAEDGGIEYIVSGPAFCTVQGAAGCSADHTRYGYCSISTYEKDSLPSAYQVISCANAACGSCCSL
jgi:hypothetical protein